MHTFAGKELIDRAYASAQRYRCYSFSDAMLIA
jgi:S-adenosylmethionine:tRNA-ribosyltransferase-isomerase (queuine synthetase)